MRRCSMTCMEAQIRIFDRKERVPVYHYSRQVGYMMGDITYIIDEDANDDIARIMKRENNKSFEVIIGNAKQEIRGHKPRKK